MGWLEDFKSRRARERTMVTINLALDFVLMEADAASGFKEPRHASVWVFRQAFSAKYPKAPKKGPEQRNLRHLLNALGNAVNKEEDTIEVSEAELEWLVKDVFKEFEISPSTYTHWQGDLTDHLDELLDGVKEGGKKAGVEKIQGEKAKDG